MKTHSLTITPEMLKLIAEIDEFRGGWKAIHGMTPERLEALRRVATVESIGSSRGHFRKRKIKHVKPIPVRLGYTLT